jgi:hypothetical protein
MHTQISPLLDGGLLRSYYTKSGIHFLLSSFCERDRTGWDGGGFDVLVLANICTS